MNDFGTPGPTPAPQSIIAEANKETVSPEFNDFLRNLTFGQRLTTAFKLTIRQFFYYLLPMITAGIISVITLAFLWPAFQVGISTAVLRQVDGDESPITFSELFTPFSRLGVMLMLALIFLGLGIAAIVIILILSMLGLIPILGIIFSFVGMVVQFIINFGLAIIMAVACFYLAEYDDTAANAVSTAFKMLKSNLGKWLSAVLGVMIVYMPLFILGIGLMLLALVPLIYFDRLGIPQINFQSGIGIGAVILLLISFLVIIAGALFVSFYSYFIYGLTYRQCIASETSGSGDAPRKAP